MKIRTLFCPKCGYYLNVTLFGNLKCSNCDTFFDYGGARLLWSDFVIGVVVVLFGLFLFVVRRLLGFLLFVKKQMVIWNNSGMR